MYIRNLENTKKKLYEKWSTGINIDLYLDDEKKEIILIPDDGYYRTDFPQSFLGSLDCKNLPSDLDSDVKKYIIDIVVKLATRNAFLINMV